MTTTTYTASQAAKKLGVHLSRVYVLIENKRLGHTRHGRSYVITDADIDLYLSVGPLASGRPSDKKKET